MRTILTATLAATLLALGAPAVAAPGTQPAPLIPPEAATSGGLDLSVRARALGVVPVPEGESSLGLEPMKAPTGAGSTRWPRPTTELGRGVYLSVDPLCLPGMDPVPLRRSTPRR